MPSRGAIRLGLLLPDSTTAVTIVTADAGSPAILGAALLSGFAETMGRERGKRSLLRIADQIIAHFTATAEALGFGEVEVKTAVDTRPVAPVRWEGRGVGHVYLVTLVASGRSGGGLDANVRVERAVPIPVDPGTRWAAIVTSASELQALVRGDVARVNNTRARLHSQRWGSSTKAPAAPLLPEPQTFPLFPAGLIPGDVERFACVPTPILAGVR